MSDRLYLEVVFYSIQLSFATFFLSLGDLHLWKSKPSFSKLFAVLILKKLKISFYSPNYLYLLIGVLGFWGFGFLGGFFTLFY